MILQSNSLLTILFLIVVLEVYSRTVKEIYCCYIFSRSALVKKNEQASAENYERITNDSPHYSPAACNAIVLAAHDTNEKPNILSAVLAPKIELEKLKRKWGFEGETFQRRLRSEQEVFFCVPLDKKEHLHLPHNVVRLVGNTLAPCRLT